MKTLIFAMALVFLSGCTYVNQKPKAIGYLIVEVVMDSENVLGELESIALKFNYTISSSQDIALGKPDVVLKRRQYESENSSFTFFFDSLSGLRCIKIGIYSDLPEKLASEELERFRTVILDAKPSLISTTENCVGMENNPSIFDIHSGA
ncbi:MAG: hypothetical protein HRT54_04355 [Colwellia sp.]|nr:hypothetical protein [Colwellia sp.]